MVVLGSSGSSFWSAESGGRFGRLGVDGELLEFEDLNLLRLAVFEDGEVVL